MTVEEIAIAALARALEFSNVIPSTRSVMYRRIGIRQQQLFARAAQINPEYFGICATGGLTDGAADLNDMTPPVESPETITRIEVDNGGTSPYAPGQEIRIVSSADVMAELPPRVTVRNRIIRQVGTDLVGVLAIRILYAKLPLAIGPTDGAVVIALPEPHAELLVVDLTKELVFKTLSMGAASRTAALEVLAAEETVLLDAFDRHVAQFVGALAARFGGASFRPIAGASA